MELPIALFLAFFILLPTSDAEQLLQTLLLLIDIFIGLLVLFLQEQHAILK